MTKKELVLELFKTKGYSCSQSVVAAYSKDIGLTEEQAIKIASGFGAGMARLGLVCGGVTGAIMVLGMKLGTIDPSDKNTMGKNYVKIQEYTKTFISKNNSLLCTDLTGFDFSTIEGREKAKEANVREKICEKLVVDCVEILEKMLQK